jgi:hypothetical protein
MLIAPLFAVDMSVVLDTCHAVEGVVKVGAQSSVLQLRCKAYSICFFTLLFLFSVLRYELHLLEFNGHV